MDAAAAITRAREASGLSKRELARRAGTSPAAIVSYESGQRIPTTATLERILQGAGYSGSILLTSTRDRPDPARADLVLQQVLALAAELPTRPAPRTLAGAGIDIVYETHSWSEDNEAGRASGWNHSRLSPRGRELAAALGARRRDDGIDVVFVSDLRRAVETAEIALGDSGIPILHDWRLRECDYGELNGHRAELVHGAGADVHRRYPGGESWAEAVERVNGLLRDLPTRWNGCRVLVIGHMAVYRALEHMARGVPLEDAGRNFVWQEGWEFRLPPPRT